MGLGKFLKKKDPAENPRSAAFTRERQVRQIHKMLTPKPKELLLSPRGVIKYGTVSMKIVNEKTKRKFRFLFLFNDVLLVTKREAAAQFRLRYYINLRNDHKIEEIEAEGNNPPEIHLICPKFTFSFICKDKQHHENWLEGISGCLEGRFDLYSRTPPSDAPPSPPCETPNTEPSVSKEVEILESQVYNFGEFNLKDFTDDDGVAFFEDFDSLTLGGMIKGEEDEDEESDEVSFEGEICEEGVSQ